MAEVPNVDKSIYPWKLIERLEYMDQFEQFEIYDEHHPGHVPMVFADWHLVREEHNEDDFQCPCGEEKESEQSFYLEKRVGTKRRHIWVGPRCLELFENGMAEKADAGIRDLNYAVFRAEFLGPKEGTSRVTFKLLDETDLPFGRDEINYLKRIFKYVFIDISYQGCFLEVS